jgi:hypothetical protein
MKTDPHEMRTVFADREARIRAVYTDENGIEYVLIDGERCDLTIAKHEPPNWDDVFAEKLVIHPADSTGNEEIGELTGDDLLF